MLRKSINSLVSLFGTLLESSNGNFETYQKKNGKNTEKTLNPVAASTSSFLQLADTAQPQKCFKSRNPTWQNDNLTVIIMVILHMFLCGSANCAKEQELPAQFFPGWTCLKWLQPPKRTTDHHSGIPLAKTRLKVFNSDIIKFISRHQCPTTLVALSSPTL